jgi:hypothetical protein
VLENYYGDKAVAGLQALGEVRFNPRGENSTTTEHVQAAQACEVFVSHRGVAAGPEFLPCLARSHRFLPLRPSTFAR